MATTKDPFDGVDLAPMKFRGDDLRLFMRVCKNCEHQVVRIADTKTWGHPRWCFDPRELVHTPQCAYLGCRCQNPEPEELTDR